MLGKLIKHEFKSTYKIGCLLLAMVLLITLFGGLAFQSPMWRGMKSSGYDVSVLDIISIFAIVMYILMLIAVEYGSMIYLVLHFYKTMYTDQGYLTHTLPVTKHQLLGSKILVSGIWLLLMGIGVIISVLFFVGTLMAHLSSDGYSLAAFWREIGEFLMDLPIFLKSELGWDVTGSLVIMVITAILSPFATVTTLFGAVSLGQLFTKYRVLMAIVCYVAIAIGSNMVESLIQACMIPLQMNDFGSYVNGSVNLSSIFSLVLAVGLYFVSWYVINNKLNME